jgi:phage tail sheath gpL-like
MPIKSVLHRTLEHMSNAHIAVLPVVDRADVHRPAGAVTLRGVPDSDGVVSIG